MIRITVELLPFGKEEFRRHLGTAYIRNDGTGTPTTGNYEVSLSKRGKPKQVWKRAKLEGFKRKRYGAWDLLALCLFAALEDRIRKMNEQDERKMK